MHPVKQDAFFCLCAFCLAERHIERVRPARAEQRAKAISAYFIFGIPGRKAWLLSYPPDKSAPCRKGTPAMIP
jgi:hypothetical protein